MSAADGGRRTRQVALVVVCLLALLVAAVATPGVAGVGGGGGGDGSGGGNGDGGSTVVDRKEDGDDGVGVDDILRWLFGDGNGEPERSVPTEYDVAVVPDPIPGRTVTVVVRRDGVPVEGARVAFNGRPIGLTNETGRVRGTVPYANDLTVRVRPPEGVAGPAEPRTAVVAAVDGPTAATTPTEGTPGNVTERYRLPTQATVTVRGTPDPGTTVTAVARVEGVPVGNATVSANGERVGRTDERGRHALRIPDDGTERVDVRVSRGPVEGSTMVAVRLLRTRVRPVDPVALPTRPATVEARVGRDPAANATVRVAGRRVATTDGGGRARVTLPADPTAAVVVTTGDRTTRRSLLSLYATTAAVLGVPVLGLAGVAAVVVRRRRTVARGVRRGVDGLAGATRALVRAVVVAARMLVTALVALARGAVMLARRGARLAARTARGLVRVPGGVVRWLRRRPGPRAVAAGLLAAPRRVVRLPWRVAGWLRGSGGGSSVGPATTTDDGGVAVRDLRACWRAFARRTLPDRWRRRTPGEVARAAVDRGLPREHVLTVTEAFRELEYGSGTLPDAERERARASFASLLDGESPDSDGRGRDRHGDGGDGE